jgi:hypothetical protein
MVASVMVLLPPSGFLTLLPGRARQEWPYRQGWRPPGQRDCNEFHRCVAPGKYLDEFRRDGKPRCAWAGTADTAFGRYHNEVWGTRT